MFLQVQEKDFGYQVGYWATALLPIILGLVITYFIIKYLKNSYKGDDDFDQDEEFGEK